MRIIARLEKGKGVRYVSHLDIQRLIQRALKRAEIPVAFSQGFNPHPLLSFATALTLGFESRAEWFDIKLASEMRPADFALAMNAALPAGFSVLEAGAFDDGVPTLSALMSAARYTVTLTGWHDAAVIAAAVEALMSGEIVVYKKTKSGMKNVDIRPQVLSFDVIDDGGAVKLDIRGKLDASGSLSVDLLMGALQKQLDAPLSFLACRDAVYFGESDTPLDASREPF